MRALLLLHMALLLGFVNTGAALATPSGLTGARPKGLELRRKECAPRAVCRTQWLSAGVSPMAREGGP